jgi:hypothetical protein
MTSYDEGNDHFVAFDKLGVTGSSPVPPTSETSASPGVFVFPTGRGYSSGKYDRARAGNTAGSMPMSVIRST